MAKFLKAPPDPNNGHIRLYWSVWDSPAWKALTPQQRLAYLALQRHLGSYNNGTLHLTLAEAKHAGIKSAATLALALRSLVAVGLIAVTREGGCERDGQRRASYYRVTHLPVFEQRVHLVDACKETHDWKGVESIKHARALIREAGAAAKVKHDRKIKTALQNLKHTDSINELVDPKTSSKIEVSPPHPSSKNEVGDLTGIARKANNGAGSGEVVDFPTRRSRTSKIEANVLLPSPRVVSDALGRQHQPARTLTELFDRLPLVKGVHIRTTKAADQKVEAVA